jgi:hypothetical protein
VYNNNIYICIIKLLNNKKINYRKPIDFQTVVNENNVFLFELYNKLFYYIYLILHGVQMLSIKKYACEFCQIAL